MNYRLEYLSQMSMNEKHIVLAKDKYVSMKEIKKGLSFINPGVKKFGVYLMQGLRKLPEDYKYILEKVKCNHEC